jgi:uncharacterized membrane protein
MATLSDVKTLGGIGSLLVLLTPIPYAGWALGIAGLVMMLFAVKYISDIVRDQQIFNNMLVSILLIIGGVVVGTLVVLGAVYRVLGMGYFVGSQFTLRSNIPVSNWIGLAGGVVVGLVVIWALLIASAVFLRKSYNTIATKINVHMFETAGLLYLIGAATAIIAVGFLLILVAQILLAVAFFSINDRIPVSNQTPGMPTMT